MCLLLALYNSNSRYSIFFPKLLLLDEPDASLHPSMTKQFLEIIQKVFVEIKNGNVIITTHSPSTVALSPEDSIFIMNKTGVKIGKISKDKAIKALLSGVNSISINYENRRQVFVESKNDVYFYEKVYENLKSKLIQEISIHFISTGKNEDGNCDQVKNIVKSLRDAGNNAVYGIIDWDLKNNGNDFVLVNGIYERYNIENYIFDPIFFIAFLIRNKIDTYNILQLTEDEKKFLNFKYINVNRFQIIINNLLNYIKPNFGNNLSKENKKIKLLNEYEINLPLWYLETNGHEIEEKLKNIFNPLKRFQKSGDLKKEIICNVIDELYEFLPLNFLNIFKKIQE